MKITTKNKPSNPKYRLSGFKITAFLLFLLPVMAFAQVTVNIKDKPIRQILKTIERNTEFRFFYNDDFNALNRVTSISVNNVSIDAAMKMLFDGSGIKWEKKDKNLIVLTPAKSTEQEPGNTKNTRRITGVVTDDSNGDVLPGVNIMVEGSRTGVISDIDGNFAIEVPYAGSTLVFSYVGYINLKVAANKSNPLKVALSPDIKKLDEVVVVGYGEMKKSDLTGSISSVRSENFNKGAQLSTQQLIQGKISGVNISQNSGKPGGASTIRVRGGTSISASNEPLYVIDGVPISSTVGNNKSDITSSVSGSSVFDNEPSNPLQTLNPNDIESVIILKDASSTAIYGSRGANGVIMITTKKGKEGSMQVTYDVSASVSNVTKKLDVLNANEYKNEVNALGLTLTDLGANTDWQNEIFRTAFSQNHYLSLTGGTSKTSYRASLGYGDQQGVMLASKMESANTRININHSSLNGKLDFDLRLNYGQTNSSQAPVSNTVGSEMGSSMLYEAYVFNPTYPVKDQNGDYYNVAPYRVNPVSYTDQVLDSKSNRRFLGDLSATLKIIKPLTLKVNVGYTYQNSDRNSYISKSNLLGIGLNGYASLQKMADYSKLLETTANYKEKFGKHNIDAMVGYSYQYFFNDYIWTTAYGFLSDQFKWNSLQAAKTISSLTTDAQSNKLISMYGRLNYNFGDKYLVTATLRRDGSSRFGAGNKWGLFPSGAISWRVSEEHFMKDNISFVDNLKLRLSYGETGNQEIGNYNSLMTMTASSSGYLVGGSKLTVVMPSQYSNNDLKWEQTSQYDAGVDFALFGSRLHGSIDWYKKVTSNLLLSVAVPSPSLVATQLANVGSVENKGVEVEIGGTIIDKKDFEWSSDFNISFNRNEVISLSNSMYKGDNIQYAPVQGQGLSGNYAQLIAPGKPLGSFYGKRFVGIENGVEQFANNGTSEWIGCAQPDFTFGWGNTFNYKNWSLNFNFRGSYGNDIFNNTSNNHGYLSNLPGRNVMDIAVSSGVKIDQAKKYSSRWIEDGSFIRLDNITLGYNFKLQNIFLKNARIYVTAQNLFVLTNYSGLDPEVNSEVTRTGVAPLGIDYLSYPKARTISIGANISF